MLPTLQRHRNVSRVNEEMQLKFEPPQGSVFGGYGFWSYSSTSHAKPSAGNANPRATPFSARLRSLTAGASRLLRLIRL
jgi:hypothetical protein